MSGGELANISSISGGISRKSLTRSGRNQTPSLQNLEDDLLIKILHRIPTTESAFRCKSVCKHWCSIISSTHFVSSFIDQHDDDEYPKKPLGILLTRLHPTRCGGSTAAIDSSVNPDFRLLNLDHLPERRGPVVVVASCNDLVLCKAMCNERRFATGSLYCYYLCNPFTREWSSFPPPPPERHECANGCAHALICEPYHQRGGGVNSAYRYRVVVSFYVKGAERVAVWTYHSETKQWIESELSGGFYSVYSVGSPVVAHNGKLHWVNLYGEYLVTYDPFNMGQTSLIDGPDFSAPRLHFRGHRVGECNGVLRVMRIEVRSDTRTPMSLNVWDLEGDDSHELRLVLKHSVPFGTIHARDAWRGDFFGDSLVSADCLAFHPTNVDVVYLSLSFKKCDLFTSYNLRSKELKLEGQFNGVEHSDYKLFPLVLPWWPTPILESVSPIS